MKKLIALLVATAFLATAGLASAKNWTTKYDKPAKAQKHQAKPAAPAKSHKHHNKKHH